MNEEQIQHPHSTFIIAQRKRLRYRSKVDSWLVALLALAVALPIAIGLLAYLRIGFAPATWLPLLTTLLVVGLVCLLAVPTRYELTSDRLLIRSGILSWEVPLSEVISIIPTSSPFSSPAWSLQRLKVTWLDAGSARSILISPQRSKDFLREVSSRNRTLVAANGGLERQ